MTFEMNTSTGQPSGNQPMASADIHQLACANCNTPLSTNYGKTALICTYCGQRHRFLEPPEETAVADFMVGDTVAVEWGGRWWSAHVVEVLGENADMQWKIHFEGWAPAFDDLVGPDRIRAIDYIPGDSIIPPPYQAEPLEVKRNNPLAAIIGIVAMLVGIGLAVAWSLYSPSEGGAPAQVEAAAIGTVSGPISNIAVTDQTAVKAGQKFHVLWEDNWYMGTAMHVDAAGNITIRYDGWGEQYDEVVSRDRLRLVR